jgi:hypothetical protein
MDAIAVRVKQEFADEEGSQIRTETNHQSHERLSRTRNDVWQLADLVSYFAYPPDGLEIVNGSEFSVGILMGNLQILSV